MVLVVHHQHAVNLVRLHDTLNFSDFRFGAHHLGLCRYDVVHGQGKETVLRGFHGAAHVTIVEGHGGTINSHIAIAEGKYTINKKLTLRGEAQYLHTKQDQGDWWYGLLELSVLPHFMFTVSDMYNAKVPNTDETATSKQHFYMVSGCYTHGAHRLQLSYGTTRAGYNCTGGVCRYVPASKGLQVSYNFNF